MSARDVATVVKYSTSRGIPRFVLLTVAYLLPSASRDGGYASDEEIAKAANLDLRSAQRAIRILKESGELAVVRGGGRGRRSFYRLAIRDVEV